MPSAADFLLSPAVQSLLKIVFAEPARAFALADLSRLSKLEMTELEQLLAQLRESGLLVDGPAAEQGPETFTVNTAFVFYAELRRIALKSFAAAEPLRAMLRSKFKGSVLRAYCLGEDPALGTLGLLLIYGEVAPDKAELDTALRKLLKTGAIRQHVQADVVSEKRFDALKPDHPLRTALAADSCVDISPAPASGKKAKPVAEQPTGLLAKARRRLQNLV